MGTIAGALSIGVAAAPVVGSVRQRRAMDKARRANRAAAAIEQAKARRQNARARRKAAIRARNAGQEALASQAAMGSVQSTGFMGTNAAIANQSASNITFQNQQDSLGRQQINFLNRANLARGEANKIGAQVGAIQALGFPTIGDFASMAVGMPSPFGGSGGQGSGFGSNAGGFSSGQFQGSGNISPNVPFTA